MSVTTEERFNVGRVIGVVFSLIGRNFVPFFALAIIFSGLPYGALLYAGSIAALNSPALVATVSIAGFVLVVLGPLILQAALLRASVDDLSGASVSLGRAIGAGFSFLLPLLGLGILMGLGITVGIIFLVIPGIIIAVRWVVAPAVLVVEGSGITEAMGRSAELTEKHRWAIFGLYVIYVIVYYALLVGVSLLTSVNPLEPEVASGDFVALAAQVVMQVLASVFGAVGAAAVYFELRRTKEGVGAAELASIFD